jgi:para-aminobenzoate synthetase component 1
VKRSVHRIDLGTEADLKQRLVRWACQFDHVCILDSNGNLDQHSNYEMLVAADSLSTFSFSGEGGLEAFEVFKKEQGDWLFGGFSYELLTSELGMKQELPDRFQIEPLRFFVPRHLLILRSGQWTYHASIEEDPERIVEEINSSALSVEEYELGEVQASISKNEYRTRLESILAHIQRGDIYEMNFCQEFFVTDQQIDPVQVYSELSQRSRPPFAAFVKWGQQYLLSASPERFLQKKGDLLVSQPIKGTRKRSQDPEEDRSLRLELSSSEKDRSENVMIVDLVRNDLSRVAQKGGVRVDELFGVYSFNTVHQMISTVSCIVKDDVGFAEIMRATYPMGSMTGAPKIRAMELIEEFESVQRGWYSGSIGYVKPGGDFDFNVVIRSIIYDKDRRLLSMHAGGAITIGSRIEDEYEECWIKADALFGALGYKERPSL